jgi:hypothetical protein
MTIAGCWLSYKQSMCQLQLLFKIIFYITGINKYILCTSSGFGRHFLGQALWKRKWRVKNIQVQAGVTIGG